MFPRMSVLVALFAAAACSVKTTETEARKSPASALPDAFVGSWRSVTPSLEFIGLSVVSKSSQQGVLATRLTYSGVALEGTATIDGDTLVAGMAPPGTSAANSVMVARATDTGTLRVQVRGTGSPLLELTFVRQD